MRQITRKSGLPVLKNCIPISHVFQQLGVDYNLVDIWEKISLKTQIQNIEYVDYLIKILIFRALINCFWSYLAG